MNELQVPGMQRHPGNSPLRRFLRMIFPVADHGVTDGGKLHPDLILQSGDERHSQQGRPPKPPYHYVSKLCPRRLPVALGAQLLKHSLSTEVVHQLPFLSRDLSAHDRHILPHRRVPQKLLHQPVPIPSGFCKQQNSRRKTINPVHHKGSLSPRLQFRGKQRPRRRRVRTLHRHRCQPGRFVNDHYCIIFVKPGQLS